MEAFGIQNQTKSSDSDFLSNSNFKELMALKKDKNAVIAADNEMSELSLPL